MESMQTTPERKSNSVKSVITFLLIVVLSIGGYYIYTLINSQKAEAQVKTQKAEAEDERSYIRNHIKDYVKVTNNNYRYSELGGIYDLEVTVTNNTDYTLDNSKVRVQYIKKNGELWRNHDVDFPMMEPRSTLTMKLSDTDRGTKVKCMLVSVDSKSLGL
jgi:hypothetical protein